MPTAAEPGTRRTAAALRERAPLLAVAATVALLYAPVLATLAGRYWQTPAHSHGPLVLLACAALFATSWHRAAARVDADPPPWGRIALLLVPAFVLHALGVLSGTVQLSMLALPLLLAGLTAWAGGIERLRAQRRFPYVFTLFLVPWPAWVTDPLTQPLKTLISWCAGHVLHALGYAVARDGVVLHLGPYQLHVADACSGIHSLFMLEAFGLLYIHLLRQPSALRQAALAALILPISFTANLLRVLTLALLTFHGGSALGQGLLHEGSGLLLFVLALLLLAPLDALLRRLAPSRDAPAAPRRQDGGALAWQRALPMVGLLLALAALLQPRAAGIAAGDVADLHQTLPTRIGDWRLVAGGPEHVVLTTPTEAETYDQHVVRTYEDSQGRRLMLNIGLVRHAADVNQTAHDPQACYLLQGFDIASAAPALVAGVAGQHMLARRGGRIEAVSYWLRHGDRYGASLMATRVNLLRERLAGRSADSALVRASLLVRHADEATAAHAALDRFLADLIAASPPAARRLLQP